MQRPNLVTMARIAALGLFWPAIALVVWGELTPYPPDILPGASDKLLHFMAYFGLSGLAVTAIGLKRTSFFVVLGLVVLGGVLEILQGFTGRDPEVLDEVANTIGTILGGLTGLGFVVALRAALLVGRGPPTSLWRTGGNIMLQDFKTFAMRGNVIDLAIGVIVGASFTGIVNSLVKDVIMPPIGLLLGGIDFSNFFIVLKGTRAVETLADAQKAGVVTINYGLFANTLINFLIVAFVMFLVVRQINRLAPSKPPPPPGPPEDLLLLREIRDLLKARS